MHLSPNAGIVCKGAYIMLLGGGCVKQIIRLLHSIFIPPKGLEVRVEGCIFHQSYAKQRVCNITEDVKEVEKGGGSFLFTAFLNLPKGLKVRRVVRRWPSSFSQHFWSLLRLYST
jgi:hypothetical protein